MSKAELVERLRTPLDCEDTLRQWDQWRKWIKEGRGSLPRDAFEAFLGSVDEERAEAADRIIALEAECAGLRAQLRELVPYSPEEIEVFQTAMDRGVWGVDDMITGTRDEKIARARECIAQAIRDIPESSGD